MENAELLKKGMELYGIEAAIEIIERFNIYKKLLLEWNEKMNLTAITEDREIIIKHFLDSVSCTQSGIEFKGKKAVDVGTGAGFPGVPLKIVFNDMDITLLDSLNKRTIFLDELMKELGLEAKIVHGRAEDFGKNPDFREAYDIVLSRAVASLNVLSEYTLPFAKVGGCLICQKGPNIHEESEGAKKAIEILGGKLQSIIPTKVYESDFTHYIAVIKKVKICPGKYPRKAGMVEKRPL